MTGFQLPAYSPDFNPIEYLWRNVKKQAHLSGREATHLKYFPSFEALTEKVETTLHEVAQLPDRILALMGRYRESLGVAACRASPRIFT